MSWNVVDLAHVPPQPWRNGGGVTRQLLALPDEQDWTVRISVADVTRDGPFSSFPGVHRCFAVLSGEGVRLRVNGVDHDLTAQDPPLHFDGADAVSCVLPGGATEDLNLMVRGRAARMERVRGSHTAMCGAGALIAVFANKHATAIGDSQGQHNLQPRTLAWRILESSERLELIGENVLWMEIEP